VLLFVPMANQEHLDILAKGVEVWNEWRREDATERPALPEGTTDDAIFSDLPRTIQGQVLSEFILFAINRPSLDLKGRAVK
jgi:hypothetical protein